MRTTKVTVLLVLLFVVAMTAGLVTGRLTSRRQQPPVRAGAGGGSPLSDQLQLTPEQSEQMRPIWEAARDTARACAKEAERIQRENDEQLKAMLTEEQKARYQQLSQENHRRIAEQDARRKMAFREAVARTEKILRPDQQRAYEQIIKNQIGAMPEVGQPEKSEP